MPVLYVRSTDGSDADNGSTWALAKATLAGAFTAAAAGDTIYVSQAHAETQASAMTLTSPGTYAAPCYVICGNDAAEPPTATATTATITTTGANAMTFGNGSCYYSGIAFNAGSGAVSSALLVTGSGYFTFRDCALKKNGTSGSTSAIKFGASGGVDSKIVLVNTTLGFGVASGEGCNIANTHLRWYGGSVTGTAPNTLFNASNGGHFVIEGVDLSGMTGKTLVSATIQDAPACYNFINCKLPASITVYGTPDLAGQPIVNIVNCDSGATNYRTEKYDPFGSQVVETTIVRTGGATDGTTSISWKIVTLANAKWAMPFRAIPMAIWNDTTGANVTVTVYGYWDAAAVPKNDEIWMEVSYMGSAATPIATINAANTKDNILTANADQDTDSSTWGGGDTTTRFKMAVTLSSPQPAMKGPIYVTIKAAKASSTFYVDPKIVLS